MKSAQEECVLCCRDITIYASGTCDHPVCYECSTRMRVLCETNECPICRSDMPIVAFTKQLMTFSSINKNKYILNKKYQIYFEDEYVSKKFFELLENKCKSCGEIFLNFDKLQEHVRRTHELHYCELCTDNLKIFTFERKCYSRKDLARHKRLGDPDQTSHRGHPLCEFCDQRYIDRDDLFRHVRREHFFCHFCDADGKYQYYRDYEYLRVHFRKEHYLCEEGECVNEKFTSAFRSEIDLKAHKAVHHSKNKSKAEVKQARMLDFEFPLAPPNRPTGSSSPRGGRYNQYRKRNVEENSSKEKTRSAQLPEFENIDTQSVQEFPFLSYDVNSRNTASDSSASESMLSSLTVQSYSRNPNPYRRNNIMSADEFPALCPTSTPEVASSQNRNLSLNRQSNAPVKISNINSQSSLRNNSTQNFNATSHRNNTMQNFNVTSNERNSKIGESTNNNKTSQQPKWIGKKSNLNFEEEFPMLDIKTPSHAVTASVPPPNARYCMTSSNAAVSNHTEKSAGPDSAISVPAAKKVANPESTVNEQFVVIKTKSKKKKPKMPPPEFDHTEQSPSKLSFNYKFNSVPDENEDIDENFKKHMVHPNLVSKPAPYKPSDTWEEKVSFRKDDFPPLEAPSAPPKKPPPGFKNSKSRAPPPGFSENVTSEANSDSKTKVLSLSSLRDIIMQGEKKTNGVDNATNSSFEKENSNLEYIYSKPPNFQDRNLGLINRIIGLPSVSPYSFQEFKQTSGQYRSDAISATEFHDKCLDILGWRGFLEIFPELLALLPDIRKQQELLSVHKKYLSEGGKDTNKYPIVSCNICNQVLITHDYKSHIEVHESEKS